MTRHSLASPLNRPLFTPGVFILLGLMATGLAFAIWRFVFGLGSITNLNDQYPWGIWIAVDIGTGVALAAGGFTTAALAHIFHREHYHAVVRPALLTALLGYTFVVLGLLVDLGRYYNVWHPLLPSMWSGRSVLFEVGICVMIYLTVLYIEFLPLVAERFLGRVQLPGMLSRLNAFTEGVLRIMDKTLARFMFLFIILGVVLSTLHQSSLGGLMVIAQHKMHPLWWTPILPLLFLLSAISVGYPMVVFESILAARSFGRRPEMHILSPLAKIIPVLLFVYLAFRAADLTQRNAWALVLEGGPESMMFLLELGLGVVVPLLLFLTPAVRESPRWLFVSSTLVILGVLLNRINVFITAYTPVYAETRYFPSLGEVMITVGLIAGLMFMYRVMVTIFPVLPAEERMEALEP